MHTCLLLSKRKQKILDYSENWNYPIILFPELFIDFQRFSTLYICIFMWKYAFHPSLSSEPVGTLDIWYMKQNISCNRQQISLFWKVSFQFKTRRQYILNCVREHVLLLPLSLQYGTLGTGELRQSMTPDRVSSAFQLSSLPVFTSLLQPTSTPRVSASELCSPFSHNSSKTGLNRDFLS